MLTIMSCIKLLALQTLTPAPLVAAGYEGD